MRHTSYFASMIILRSSALPLMLLLMSTNLRGAPTTIIYHGDPSNRIDVVFLGDGYTQADLDTGGYDQHIQGVLTHMFSDSGFLADPFPRYRNFFNVHKITVVSNESGADIPSQGIYRDTALNASYGVEMEQALSISVPEASLNLVRELVGSGISVEMLLVSVNHTMSGGTATGDWAVFAGAQVAAPEAALHQVGHTFAGLADEFADPGGEWLGSEPPEPNVTTDPTGSDKWYRWLGFEDPRGPSLDVSVFEGAYYHTTGIYRSSLNSKMKSLNQPFNAVGREEIILEIYRNVDPLDDWLDNTATVTNAVLWVDVIDPNVILLQWSVDGMVVEGATGETFNPLEYGYGPGTYDVRVRAYDSALDHSFSGDLLDLVRWDDEPFLTMRQHISWMLTVTNAGVGDYDGDRDADGNDFLVWQRNVGGTATPVGTGADGNGDGVVDGADYQLWRDHFASSHGMAAMTSVPEVATSALFAIAVTLSFSKFRLSGKRPDTAGSVRCSAILGQSNSLFWGSSL